jgi:hypothetical protein
VLLLLYDGKQQQNAGNGYDVDDVDDNDVVSPQQLLRYGEKEYSCFRGGWYASAATTETTTSAAFF